MENDPGNQQLEAARRAALIEACEYRARLESMSYLEAIGAILGRSQIIEEVMRYQIARTSTKYGHPKEVSGTFGFLLSVFRDLYPDQIDLISWLETARDARNSAAHDDLLYALSVREVLADHPEEDVDHFLRRGFRKTIEGMDLTLAKMLAFHDANPVEFDSWVEE